MMYYLLTIIPNQSFEYQRRLREEEASDKQSIVIGGVWRRQCRQKKILIKYNFRFSITAIFLVYGLELMFFIDQSPKNISSNP